MGVRRQRGQRQSESSSKTGKTWFKISNAMTPDGQPAGLRYIDFIKCRAPSTAAPETGRTLDRSRRNGRRREPQPITPFPTATHETILTTDSARGFMPLRPRRLHEVGLRPHGGFSRRRNGGCSSSTRACSSTETPRCRITTRKRNRRKRSFPPGQRLSLGDVAQSMTLHNGVGWIAVNTRACRFRRRPRHLPRGGRITNPHLAAVHPFRFDEKAYVTQILGQPHLHRQPQTLRNHGIYRVPDMTAGIRLHGADGAVRQIRLRELLVLPEPYPSKSTPRPTGSSVSSTVGIQPASLAMDRNNKLWTVTDGGLREGSPFTI